MHNKLNLGFLICFIFIAVFISPCSFAPEPILSGEEQTETHTGTVIRTVEAGGWLLQAENNKKYLLLSIGKYTKEEWFEEGVFIQVVGTPDPKTVTIYMEGIPFRVKSMMSINQEDDEEAKSQKEWKQICEIWEDTWFVLPNKMGYYHIAVSENKEGQVVIKDEVKFKSKISLTTETVCRKNKYLSPVTAKCQTDINGQMIMEGELLFGKDNNVKLNSKILRDKKTFKPLNQPQEIKKELELTDNVVLQPALLICASLNRLNTDGLDITLLNFPDDLDNLITQPTMEHTLSGELVHNDEDKQDYYQVTTTHGGNYFIFTLDGRLKESRLFTPSTEKEARAIFDEKN
ncbi:MAG: hypothetical protein AAB019_09720 [Planctomycetota bacterium]